MGLGGQIVRFAEPSTLEGREWGQMGQVVHLTEQSILEWP